MKINTYGSQICDLPAAYFELEEISRILDNFEDASGTSFRAWRAAGQLDPEAFIGRTWASEPEALKYRNLRAGQLSRLPGVFARAFEQEVKAQRFEIFEAENFLFFLSEENIRPLISPLLEESEEVASRMIALLDPSVRPLSRFLEAFRSHLSSSSIDHLWELFKTYLNRELPVWNTEHRIRNRDSSLDSSSAGKGGTFLLILGLKEFLGCPNASRRVIDEALSLLPLRHLELVLRHRSEPSEGEIFKHSLDLENFPMIFKASDPEAFQQRLTLSAADPVVVEMLIENWRSDLESLLSAAKSLSAEDPEMSPPSVSRS